MGVGSARAGAATQRAGRTATADFPPIDALLKLGLDDLVRRTASAAPLRCAPLQRAALRCVAPIQCW
jgi:hypothetical protein